MRALLLSTYELGHQPLHVAAPAAAVQRAGHDVRCADLSVETLPPDAVQWADAVAVSVPMHTAMRLARAVTAQIRAMRPSLPVCFYGLYGAVDDGAEHDGTADHAIAGEYGPALVEWFDGLAAGAPAPQPARVELGRHPVALPARRLLPSLERYAGVTAGGVTRLAGYVEASHGCVHRCRHCPVPVVYDGRTRVVQVDAVLADVAQLVALGAEHVTFGDPDFLSGPHHARRVVHEVHRAFPELTFDVTVKVEHVLAHEGLWAEMAAAGCLFVVSAFESATDAILSRLDKGHTVADARRAVAVLRANGIEPRPSLLPFTPWTVAADVWNLLDLVAEADLVGNVDPVHYAIRLLVPPGSLLLDSGDLDGLLGGYDHEHLGWQWRSADVRLDELQARLAALAEEFGSDWDPPAVYDAVRATSAAMLGEPARRQAPAPDPALRSALAVSDRPRLTEAWFCCAEPTDAQLIAARGDMTAPAGGR